MATLDWRRAKPALETADSIGEGVKRKDGTVTKTLPKDSLARRAARAEAKWLRDNGLAIDAKGRIGREGHRKG